MRKASIIILTLMVLAGGIFFTGCNEQPVSPKGVQVELCYISNAYIASGEINDDIWEEYETFIDNGDTLPMDILTALRTVPADWKLAESYSTAIGENIVFNKAWIDRGVVFVDISSEGLSGGSLEESLLIEQITRTFFESFDDETVEKVQFLVDGENVDTLMGQMDVSTPFTRPED